MNVRINVYIRKKTKELLDDYSKINEYDLSRAVDEIIYGRLSFLEEAERKKKKELELQQKKEEQTKFMEIVDIVESFTNEDTTNMMYNQEEILNKYGITLEQYQAANRYIRRQEKWKK